MQKLTSFRISGLSLPLYILVALIILISLYFGVLPGGMVGAFLFLIIFGDLLNLIGNELPIIKTYFGGGAIVSIFGGAALMYFNLIPKEAADSICTFMKGGGFLDFYIAALITGSILGMNRKLLVRAFVKYLPCLVAATAFALGFVALGALIAGKSPSEAIAYIGIPIMGGGMGAGAVPISKVFSKALNIPVETIMSSLVPAVALGNALAIVFGGLLDRLGKAFPSLSGEGSLVRTQDESLKSEAKDIPVAASVQDYGTGIALATAFFAFGHIVAYVMKTLTPFDIHPYAWMIISVALVKGFNLLPARYEQICEAWYDFIAKNFTAALMLGIGMAYTDLGDVLQALTPSYFIFVLLVVLGSIVGGGLMGHLVGFYFVESAITSGLCMANMGGTGDVAVLTAAKRMQLMPFAQISSRLGGALIILIASVLVPLFF